MNCVTNSGFPEILVRTFRNVNIIDWAFATMTAICNGSAEVGAITGTHQLRFFFCHVI